MPKGSSSKSVNPEDTHLLPPNTNYFLKPESQVTNKIIEYEGEITKKIQRQLKSFKIEISKLLKTFRTEILYILKEKNEKLISMESNIELLTKRNNELKNR